MSISAYPIGRKVWIVHTDEVANQEVPKTLPIGSTALTPREAEAFIQQLTAAAQDAARRSLA